jgi:hypothetical protein
MNALGGVRNVVLVLAMIAAVPLGAAQVMKEVWFPDGVITWRTTDFSGGLRPGVLDAMQYLEERTPLRLSETANGRLEIRLQKGLFDGMYGGMTKGYRNAKKDEPLIRLSSELTSATSVRNTLLHELGHALGFTHEFQRDDRSDFVTVCAACDLDPFNFDKVSGKQASILTPYDFSSRFSTGYQGVTPLPLTPSGLSPHDINGIYRVYGRALSDTAVASDRFGVAVTTGDYDDDDIEDVAVASVELDGKGLPFVTINFFKGVATAPGDSGTGTSYMPWFRSNVGSVDPDNQGVSLASGDLRRRSTSGGVERGRDGIDEVVVGLPGSIGDEGAVLILTVNVEERFGTDEPPYGGRNVFHSATIRRNDVGLTSAKHEDFGQAVYVAKLSDSSADDLVIGVPGTTRVEGTVIAHDAGAIVILPGGDSAAAIVMTNPSGAHVSRYGASLGAIPGLWKQGTGRYDALLVGAPVEDVNSTENSGAVYVYRMAMTAAGAPVAPSTMYKMIESGADARFGESIVGFVTNQGNDSWFPVYHLAVGAPGRVYKDHVGGSVFVYDVTEEGAVKEIASRGMPQKQQGADFGTALAVQRANCVSGQCARGDVHLAIGAPHTTTSGVRTGAVYRWDPWSKDGNVDTSAVPALMEAGTEHAEYGFALATIRATEGGGGFVIGSPDLRVLTGMTSQVPAGSAVVQLNQGSPNAWSSWTRILSKLTTGDRRPVN